MTRILGLSGPAGVGKSTVARLICLELAKAKRTSLVISFATPMKEMVVALMETAGVPIPRERMRDQELKQMPVPELGDATPRHLLQTLGTEWGRDCISESLWTDIALGRAERSGAGVAIIDDVRFPNELEAIQAEGGGVYGLKRMGVEYNTSHTSEQPLLVPIASNDGKPQDTAKMILRSFDAQ